MTWTKEIENHGWRYYFRRLQEQHAVSFDWSTDGCSNAPDSILGVIQLSGGCQLHDFVYRNHKLLDSLGIHITRREADTLLWQGIRDSVKNSLGFRGIITASLYFTAVRLFGGKAWDANS